MKCIIVEDEIHAAEHLQYMLSKLSHHIEVVKVLNSIKSTVSFLLQQQVDLIFMDVQLADGNSFAIFDNIEITTPVIFTTSYDNFALQAFKLNSIAYLLKPIDEKELKQALDKYEMLTHQYQYYNDLGRSLHPYQKKFLLEQGNQIIVLNDAAIAYIGLINKHVFITNTNGQQYLFNSTLDKLEHRLNPELFFRINRQFIINKQAISEMINETRGRVKIITCPPSKEEMVVSIERAPDFKSWIRM